MSKQEMIASIQRHNPTADAAFLEGFENGELDHYLRRLHYVGAGRAAATHWVREPETSAIVVRRVA